MSILRAKRRSLHRWHVQEPVAVNSKSSCWILKHWSQVVPGVEVKMVTHPDGAGIEQFVLCRSKSRREKEAAMLRQKFERLLDKLEAIDRSLRKGPGRDGRR